MDKNVGNNNLTLLLTPKIAAGSAHKTPKGHLSASEAAEALRPLPHVGIEKIFLKNGKLCVRLASRGNRRLTRADLKQARLVLACGGRTFSWQLADIDRTMRMSRAVRPLDFDTGIRVKTKVHVTARLQKVSGHAVKFAWLEPKQRPANFSKREIKIGRNIPAKTMDLPLTPKGPNFSLAPRQALPVGKNMTIQKEPGWSRYLPNLVLWKAQYDNNMRNVSFWIINYGAPFIGDARVEVRALDRALAAADNQYTHQFTGGNYNTLNQSGIPFIVSKPFDWPSYACSEGFSALVALVLKDGTTKSFYWEVERVYRLNGPVKILRDVNGPPEQFFMDHLQFSCSKHQLEHIWGYLSRSWAAKVLDNWCQLATY